MNYMIENLIKLADMFDQAEESEKADQIDDMIQLMAKSKEKVIQSDQSLKTEAQNTYSNTMSKIYAELRQVGKQNALSILKELNDMFTRMSSENAEMDKSATSEFTDPPSEEQEKEMYDELTKMKSERGNLSEDEKEYLDGLEEAKNELLTYERYATFDEETMNRVKEIDRQIQELKDKSVKRGLENPMASLSDMADSLDKIGATKAADKIDAFLEKYGDVDWKEEGNTEQSKRYDDRHHHEQQVKEPKDYHKNGPDEHHIKEYDKSRKTLQTRYCPDHPGTMMGRVSEGIYQCPLDGQTYNWQDGFDTEDGTHIDGGSVGSQTPNSTGYFATPSRIFDSREEIINRIN